MDSTYSQLIQSLITSTKSIFPDNKVIRAQQGGNEPTNPYVVVQVIREDQVGTPYVDTLLSTTNKITTTVVYDALVQFSFISKDSDAAGNMVKQFVQLMKTPSTREVFRINRLSCRQISSVRTVSSLREGEWVQHYNVDATFSYASITEQTYQPITSVTLEDEMSGEVTTIPPEVIIP